PDVIMVGEIRDLETAQIAIQASLTGHLVLSTLHTNDAAGAVTRLTDMGIEPFLIASTLEAVLAQRLVRRVCSHCAIERPLTSEDAARLGMTQVPGEKKILNRGGGCSHCGKTGYRGRSGIYEWLRLSEAIRQLVTSRAPTLEIRRTARNEGMQTLRESGTQAVLGRVTTIEEVLNCT
ncbi:MAG: ATPase, T2SS/T4P/T4SS family, partial [Opitutus sp.]